jgi:hypothetical protein
VDVSTDSNATEIRITVRRATHPDPKLQNSPSIPPSSILAIGMQTQPPHGRYAPASFLNKSQNQAVTLSLNNSQMFTFHSLFPVSIAPAGRVTRPGRA